VRAERLRLQSGAGRDVVRQRVAHSAPLWRCAASATVQLTTARLPDGAMALTFDELSGASPVGQLSGRWVVSPAEASAPHRCALSYEASLSPRAGAPPLPPAAARRLLAEGAAALVRGVAAAAERAAAAAAGPPWLEALPLPAGVSSASAAGAGAPDAASEENPFGPREMWGAAALPLSQWAPPNFLGLSAVPLPPSAPVASSSSSASAAAADASSAAPDDDVSFGRASLRLARGDAEPPPLQEVHMRRLDGAEGFHRRAVATVRVAAPVEFTWAALTDWRRHADFLPGVAVAQLLSATSAADGGAAAAAQPAQPAGAQAAALARGRRRVRYLTARVAGYVAAHGVCTLDILEKGGDTPVAASSSASSHAAAAEAPPREVQFRVLPDPGGPLLRGKWLVSPDNADEAEDEAEAAGGDASFDERAQAEVDDDDDAAAENVAASSSADAAGGAADGGVTSALRGSLLKVAVEARAPWDAASGEPLSERCVYEGVPALLAALAARAEALWAAARAPAGAAPPALAAAAAAPAAALAAPAAALAAAAALGSNPEDLRAALLAAGFGADGTMPSRTALRAAGRATVPLEYAITSAGGFAAVAAALSWRLSYRPRKPRGYWDRLENVEREIRAFIAERQLEPGVMPTRQSFAACGRSDLAKLAERWGGAASLAEELGLRPARSGRGVSAGLRRWNAHVAAVAAQTGLSTRELFEVASATYVPVAQLPGAGEEGEAEGAEEEEAAAASAGGAASAAAALQVVAGALRGADSSASAAQQPAPVPMPAPSSLWLSDWRRAGAPGGGGDATPPAGTPDPAAG
jgi:hypothetical protein